MAAGQWRIIALMAGVWQELDRIVRPQGRVFYGWWIVLASSGVQWLAAVLWMQSYGAYMVLLQQDFGWSKAMVAGAFALTRIESGILGPLQGWLVDRFGPRAILTIGTVLFGVGFILFGQVESLLTFYLTFALIALGASLGGFATLMVAIVNWFSRHRSKAIAVSQLGFSLGGLSVPLIIWGCENDEKDNNVLPRCSQEANGERCLMGTVTEDNYKTLVAACQADGHSLIGLSPIDINIAKQVNILVSEMGFPLDRVAMYPTTGGLGYGLEYTYSIQERGRVAALSGDRLMSVPVICMVGQEAWRAKEARTPAEEQPDWGDADLRGINWEVATATALLQAGSDILVMRHPAALAAVRETLDRLMN